MDNNKKSILPIIGLLLFAILLVSAYFGYGFLSSKYNKKNASSENLQINNEASAIDLDNNNVLAKDFVVYDDNLKEVKLSDYIGKPVVINYWASWCPPCKSEMPAFNEMSEKYTTDKVAILMINATDGQRETMSIAKQFIDKNNYNMKVFYDSKMEVANKYNVSSIPRTIFINKDGYIIEDHTSIISKEELENKIKLLIE